MTPIGLIAAFVILGGCASMDVTRASKHLQTAQVTLDTIVEDRTAKWAQRMHETISACETHGQQQGDACLHEQRPRQDCEDLAVQAFDACSAQTLHDAQKAQRAFKKLVAAQEALTAVRKAIAELDEVLR